MIPCAHPAPQYTQNTRGLKTQMKTKADHIELGNRKRRDDRRRLKGHGNSLSSDGCLSICDLEDPPRVVLVIRNASIAHPPLGHDGRVKTGVGE